MGICCPVRGQVSGPFFEKLIQVINIKKINNTIGTGDTFNMKKIHMIGIGGISMSGIAELLLSGGFQVSGSDSKESDITKRLEELGARIGYPQKADNIPEDCDTVVMTAAIHDDNPELIEAKNRGIKIYTRAEFLGLIMKDYKMPIAIAGTHGKTTTTAMISEILLAAELDPTISIGGMLRDIGGNFRVGSRDYFVMEACEYTNSYHSFFPGVGLILNVDEDHLDFFKDLDDIVESFHKFATNVFDDGTLVIGKDTKGYDRIIRDLNCKVVTFGFDDSADIYPEDISYDEWGHPSFTAVYKGNKEAYSLGVSGEHNVMNALAAIAACDSLGISSDAIRKGLSVYKGTDRRFEKKGTLKVDKGEITIVDDYAHHPTEITATLKTAKRVPCNEIWTIFQPHTYTRTKALLDEIAEALCLSDHVIIAKIYPARETDNLGISGEDVASAVRKNGTDCYYFDTFEEAENFVTKTLVDNDLLITMGAGDVVNIADELLSKR